MEFIVNKLIWGWPAIGLLFVVSIYFCFRFHFVQFRLIKLFPKLLFEKNQEGSKISSFQTISLILANHVGSGNIVGVSIAILYGGPGAVFWMWVTALLCAVLSFSENTLGQMYKTEVNGEFRGGPAYYILKGIGSPFWSHLIAFIFLFCLGLLMPTIQSATIATTVNTTFAFPKILVGLVVTLGIGIIIFGNSKRIVKVSEVMVPFMAFFYLLVALIVIIINLGRIGDVFTMIFTNALNNNAIFGGIIGSAIAYGVRRSIFSNEAGIGSSSNISASSNVDHPVKQGLISTFCIYIDTIIICTSTALMILITNCFNVIDLKSGSVIYEGIPQHGYGEFVSESINTVLNNWGSFFVAIALFFFAFTSIFGGFYNAQSNLIFIFKNKSYKYANFLYKCIFLLIIFISSVFNTDMAWLITDLGMGIAFLINIVVLLILGNKVVEALRDFELKYRRKENTKYINNNLECWRK